MTLVVEWAMKSGGITMIKKAAFHGLRLSVALLAL
jgi:hypothetical protein